MGLCQAGEVAARLYPTDKVLNCYYNIPVQSVLQTH